MRVRSALYYKRPTATANPKGARVEYVRLRFEMFAYVDFRKQSRILYAASFLKGHTISTFKAYLQCALQFLKWWTALSWEAVTSRRRATFRLQSNRWRLVWKEDLEVIRYHHIFKAPAQLKGRLLRMFRCACYWCTKMDWFLFGNGTGTAEECVLSLFRDAFALLLDDFLFFTVSRSPPERFRRSPLKSCGQRKDAWKGIWVHNTKLKTHG